MIDFSTIFSQLLSSFWWVLPLFILLTLFKSAWFKGFIGEVMVNMSARLFLNKKEYHLIKNVTIPTEGGTTQIDHIIVSRFGVFVVETNSLTHAWHRYWMLIDSSMLAKASIDCFMTLIWYI